MYWPFSGTSAGSGVRLLERRIRRLRRRKRAAVDAGTVEHADRARLLPQRSLPAVLGLPAAQAGRPPLGEMDALSHAFPAGTVQESISHRSFGFRTAENFIAAIDYCCARLASRRSLLMKAPKCSITGCGLPLMVGDGTLANIRLAEHGELMGTCPFHYLQSITLDEQRHFLTIWAGPQRNTTGRAPVNV